jgi:hypothetical protein
VGLTYAAEVVAIDGGYFDGATALTEALASAPTGKGPQRYTGAP